MIRKNIQYWVWPPFASCSATHLLRIELIRLLIAACGMLSHSSIAVRSCWVLAGTGIRCRTCRSRASQTCSKGDLSSEYTVHGRTRKFSASTNCVQLLPTRQHNIMRKNEVMVASEWQDLIMVSLCVEIAIDKMQLCSLSVAYACPHHNPTTTMGTLFTTLTSANRSPTLRHTWSAVWGRLDVLLNFKRLMVEKLTFNSSCGHSCSQHANCTLHQNLRCGVVWQNCTF